MSTGDCFQDGGLSTGPAFLALTLDEQSGFASSPGKFDGSFDSDRIIGIINGEFVRSASEHPFQECVPL